MALIRITKASTLVVVIWLTTGCATNESDAGAQLGAVIGVAAAGLNCAIKGKSGAECAPDLLIGASAGLLLGKIQGTRLEKRRKEGEEELAFIQRNNQELIARNQQLKQELTQAKSLIDEALAQRDTLKESASTSSEKESEFKQMAIAATQKREKVEGQIKDNKIELADQEALLASIESSGTAGDEAQKLKKAVSSLREQITLLEETEQELASVSSTKF